MRFDACCSVLPEGVDKLHHLPYTPHMPKRRDSVRPLTSHARRGSSNRRELEVSPVNPESAPNPLLGSRSGAAAARDTKRLTPSAKETVQVMLASWALRHMVALRTGQSPPRKSQPR